MAQTQRIAVLQMNSGIDPKRNSRSIAMAAHEAKREGAQMLFTPEMSGFLDRNRARAATTIRSEADDIVLNEAREVAATAGIWIGLGSLAIRDGEKWVNRSFVIDADGQIVARYDKIHMFDVDLPTGESWKESASYEAGNSVVAVETPLGQLGLAICYDIRFPALFEALGHKNCDLISIPAAFTVPTGRDHWHVLQRARAIENSAYVVAAAQVGSHQDGRKTYGHSLVVDPWGKVLLDMGGDQSGLGYAEIDQDRIAEVRKPLPSLANRREIAK